MFYILQFNICPNHWDILCFLPLYISSIYNISDKKVFKKSRKENKILALRYIDQGVSQDGFWGASLSSVSTRKYRAGGRSVPTDVL